MVQENKAITEFKELMKQRREEYERRMKQLDKAIAEGKAGMVSDNGQWYLSDGSERQSISFTRKSNKLEI